MQVRGLLFPDPPRQIRRHRALGVSLRTAHLMTFGALLGGHLFDVDPARLMPFLIATVASGLALMALELASTCAWLFMGKGLAVLLKLLVLLMVPVFWEHRVSLLLLVVAMASIGSHMPSRFRHRPIAEAPDGALEARVHPTMIPAGWPTAAVPGVFNTRVNRGRPDPRSARNRATGRGARATT